MYVEGGNGGTAGTSCAAAPRQMRAPSLPRHLHPAPLPPPHQIMVHLMDRRTLEASLARGRGGAARSSSGRAARWRGGGGGEGEAAAVTMSLTASLVLDFDGLLAGGGSKAGAGDEPGLWRAWRWGKGIALARETHATPHGAFMRSPRCLLSRTRVPSPPSYTLSSLSTPPDEGTPLQLLVPAIEHQLRSMAGPGSPSGSHSKVRSSLLLGCHIVFVRCPLLLAEGAASNVEGGGAPGSPSRASDGTAGAADGSEELLEGCVTLLAQLDACLQRGSEAQRDLLKTQVGWRGGAPAQ
jgi:hypothetical protein